MNFIQIRSVTMKNSIRSRRVYRSGFKKVMKNIYRCSAKTTGERGSKNGYRMYRNENQSGIWKCSEEILGYEIIRFPRDGSEVPGIDGFESVTVALFDI